MNGGGGGGNGKQHPNPSILIQKCKNLKLANLKKEQNLNFLAQIISNLYHDSLPIIQTYARNERDNEEEDESSDSSEESVSEIDGLPELKINSSIDYVEDDEHPTIYH